MDVIKAIKTRRSLRSLERFEVTDDLIRTLGESIQLSPSCFNNQPWRFVFVYEPSVLESVFSALSRGNEWVKNATLLIAVITNRELDCVIHTREYYLFDTGIATGFLLLRLTELGLVSHPIAGFKHKKVREILDIPDRMTVISLIVIGKRAEKINPLLSDTQKGEEIYRPDRKKLEEFVFANKYGNPFLSGSSGITDS
jgi:nitroreductase